MTRTSFGDQLQQIWRTRPVRLPRHGPIAGVAAGFGRRYNVDPVLIRVAFVVSSMFGGAGIMLYLLAWLLLAEEGERLSPAESLFGRKQYGEQTGQSQTKTIVLMVALAIAVTTVGPIGVEMAGSGMISLALMLAGWWMLFMRFPQPPPGTSPWDADDVPTTATGYPGTAFPAAPPRPPGAYYSPFGSSAPPQAAQSPAPPMYTPYTKLPEYYEPDPRTDVTVSDPAASTPAAPEAPEAENPKPSTSASATASDSSPTTSPNPEKPADTDNPATQGTAATQDTAEASDTPKTADPAPADGIGPNLRKSPSGDGGSPTATRDPLPTGLPGLDTPVPPAWDPLGVAPLAWDLPDPTPACPIATVEPERPRSRFTPVVLGLAILAAAGAGALAAAGVEWMTPGRIAAVALAVIGLGLVAGAFLRRGHGLLVVTAPLAGFVLLASLIGPIDIDSTTMGTREWAPASVADLESRYQLTMGDATLDLRSVQLTEDRTVDIDVRMGEVRILVPADMTLRTDCDVSIGEMQCPSGISGPNTPGAPVLDLNIDVHMGNVEVHRD
ncbi:PspC domain-containing protein [Nocardia shimofusensis]|uniref:PspC domain-containing protein n=1 Tax=Nocardia shimofusensis TaxID=228596 RepID=UPI0009FE5E29|nr:PspC domain-containing protein [Nocardia shimofusensis]